MGLEKGLGCGQNEKDDRRVRAMADKLLAVNDVIGNIFKRA